MTSPLHKRGETDDIVVMGRHENIEANTRCSPTDAEAFLSLAETIAESQGQRMTRIRRKVLQLLIEAPEPAKAYDLLDRLDGEGSPKPPTIYRALDFLQELGLAHKIESLNAFVACGHANHGHAAVFLICEDCGVAEELHSKATVPALNAEAEGVGFALSRAVIEAKGTCRDCIAKPKT
ncbi:MAG: Fur family transcriptional regulator [Pseudomonadota bacterium]